MIEFDNEIAVAQRDIIVYAIIARIKRNAVPYGTREEFLKMSILEK